MPLWLLLCFLVVCASANVVFSAKASQKKRGRPRSSNKIELRKAALMVQRPTMPQVIVLIDSVTLYHDGALMHCDSAYYNETENTFDAFGRVRINQGDTIHLRGDYMKYDGIYRMAMVRHNVVLEDRKAKTTLHTDSLNYDRMANIAYYFDGGTIIDPQNELTSVWGQYEPNLRLATFRDSVKLYGKQQTITADTLQYNTRNSVATILGPAVVESDSGVIYTSKGWYNTKTEESMLMNQSIVVNKDETQFLTGDSIHYNRAEMRGDVYGNMVLHDTVRKVILKGERGHYNGNLKLAWATHKAQALEYSNKDTIFLHADTLKMEQRADSVNLLKAFRNVRFYRTDIQGVADSLHYNTKDSLMQLFRSAVLWNSGYQVAGDSISVFMRDSVVDSMLVKKDAYIVEQLDSLKLNQIKGRIIRAYMHDNELKRVYVDGNAESIFYPQEKDKSFVGHNQTESGYITMEFEQRKVKRLKLWAEPKALMTPLPEVQPDKLKLKGVWWLDYIRPRNKDDIFRKVSRRQDEQSEVRNDKRTP